MQAWIEVNLEKLKTDLDLYKTAHKAHTEEFCSEQMSALESYLDTYLVHAGGIHALTHQTSQRYYSNVS
jgi:hypothetical protein